MRMTFCLLQKQKAATDFTDFTKEKIILVKSVKSVAAFTVLGNNSHLHDILMRYWVRPIPFDTCEK
jgi:hypothetical protein